MQGVYTVRAGQTVQKPWPIISNTLIAFPHKGAKSSTFQQSKISKSIQIKSNRPRFSIKDQLNNKESVKIGIELLNKLDELALPQTINEVTTKRLQPISLNEIESLVKINSPTLKIAKSRINQAKSLLLSSISAWYPSINLSANGLPQYLITESYSNPDYSSTEKTHGKELKASTSITAQWNLIDPARVPEIAAARDKYEQAKARYLIILRDLKLEALTKYFWLQQAGEGVRIGKESMKASLLSLSDAKARYEAGLSTRLEVLEAETQLARDKQLLTRKLGEQSKNRRDLASLLNLPPGTTPTAASPAKVIGSWNTSLQESIIAAYSFREELDNALLEISVNNSNANSALASNQPTLSIFNTFSASHAQGQLGKSSNSKIKMDDNNSNITNTIGLKANWSLFDGGRAKNLYRYNKHKAEESRHQFTDIKNSIRKEVEQSFYNLESATQDISTTTREVIASRESLRLARLRFKAGVTSQREIVNNQRDLTTAEVRYSDAITAYNQSLAELRRRTGIDPIQACKAEAISAQKPEINEFINIPIEPFNLTPACEASTIRSKK